jgi:hypothetical protein
MQLTGLQADSPVYITNESQAPFGFGENATHYQYRKRVEKKGQSHLVTLKMVFAKTLEEKHSRFLGKVFDYCTNTGPTNPLHSWKSHGNDE